MRALTQPGARPWRSHSLAWVLVLALVEAILCGGLVEPAARPTSALGCATVSANRWNELPGLEYTGRLRLDLPREASGTLTLLVGDRIPVEMTAETADGLPMPFAQTPVAALEAPGDLWLEYGTPWGAPPQIARATFWSSAGEDRVVLVNLGRRAPRLLARLGERYDSQARARVCAAAVAAAPAFTAGRRLRVEAGDAGYFAAGWRAVEQPAESARLVRWMDGHGVVLVPSSRDGDVQVTLRAFAPRVEPQVASLVTLHVNDVFDTSPQPLRKGLADYAWIVPAIAWVTGTNELLFVVSRPRPQRGAAGGSAGGFALERLELELRR